MLIALLDALTASSGTGVVVDEGFTAAAAAAFGVEKDVEAAGVGVVQDVFRTGEEFGIGDFGWGGVRTGPAE